MSRDAFTKKPPPRPQPCAQPCSRTKPVWKAPPSTSATARWWPPWAGAWQARRRQGQHGQGGRRHGYCQHRHTFTHLWVFLCQKCTCLLLWNKWPRPVCRWRPLPGSGKPETGLLTLVDNTVAEHKTIHAYEAGVPLTVENVQKFSTLHPRCGTSFLLIVMIVSILMFAFLGWPDLWREYYQGLFCCR